MNVESQRWNYRKSSPNEEFIDQQIPTYKANYRPSHNHHLIQVPPPSSKNYNFKRESEYQNYEYQHPNQEKQFYSTQQISEKLRAANNNSDMHSSTGKSVHKQFSKYQQDRSSFGHHGRVQQFSAQITSIQNYTNYQTESEETQYGKHYSTKLERRFDKRYRDSQEHVNDDTPYRYANQHGSRIKDNHRENHHSYTGISKSNLQQSYHNEEGEQVVIPQRQPLIVCQEAMEEMAALQRGFYRMAERGDLLIELQDFLTVLRETEEEALQGLYDSDFEELLDIAENEGIIHITKRNFAKMKTLCFVSLQIDVLSLECISWVLQSLKNDEMSPTERAIQSRIKEAFAFKIGNDLWQLFVNQIERGCGSLDKRSHHKNTGTPKPKFCVKEIIEDPSTGQMAKAIYPKDEEWEGVDQSLEAIDQTQYQSLKEFLEDYFCSKYNDDQSSSLEDIKWCSSLENGLTRVIQQQNSQKFHHIYVNSSQDIDFEEVRAIPGGRYGCAQFIKICGPPALKACSLGRLAQFVQHAVKEDVLRYHKTLLIWTAAVDKHKKQTPNTSSSSICETSENKHLINIERKLNHIKQALIDILEENQEGMSLAQLPLYLRRRLSFPLDLNELGFPKLKDLIISMSDKIQLEHRGHNHPFATLIKNYPSRTVFNKDEQKHIPKNQTSTNSPQLELISIKETQVSNSPKGQVDQSIETVNVNENSSLINFQGNNQSTKLTLLSKKCNEDEIHSDKSCEISSIEKEELIREEKQEMEPKNTEQNYLENQAKLPLIKQDNSFYEIDQTNIKITPKVHDKIQDSITKSHGALTSKFCYSQTLRNININSNSKFQAATSAKHTSDAFDLDSFTQSIRQVKNNNCQNQVQETQHEDCNEAISKNSETKLSTNGFNDLQKQDRKDCGKKSPQSNQQFSNKTIGSCNHQIQTNIISAHQIQLDQLKQQCFNEKSKNKGIEEGIISQVPDYFTTMKRQKYQPVQNYQLCISGVCLSEIEVSNSNTHPFILPHPYSNVSIPTLSSNYPPLPQKQNNPNQLSGMSQIPSPGATSQNSKGSSATSVVQPFEKTNALNQFYQSSSFNNDETEDADDMNI